MKEEIIREVAGMTKEGILQGIDILQQEVPELIQQIYRWEFTIGAFCFLLGIGLSFAAKKFFSLAKGDELSYDMEFVYYTSVIVCGIAGTAMSLCNAIKMLKIVVVPKLYLVNYIFDLVKATD